MSNEAYPMLDQYMADVAAKNAAAPEPDLGTRWRIIRATFDQDTADRIIKAEIAELCKDTPITQPGE